MSDDFERRVAEEARLIVLRTLAEQADGTLNEALLATTLEAFGLRRSREWLRTQLRKLAELGAVTLAEPKPGFLVASLTRAGLDHVERRSVIDGVKRPSPAGS